MTLTIAPIAIADLHTPRRVRVQRLRNTLRTNAGTSLVAGALAAAAPATLDRFLGTGSPALVRVVGVALCVFAVDVAVLAGARRRHVSRWTSVIIAADIGWVAATAVTIAAGWYSVGGAVALALTGTMVGVFASLQWRHLHSFRNGAVGGDESPPIELASARATVDAEPGRVWAIITDHSLYGRLAPNLTAVVATSDNGPDLRRTCVNRKGQEWHETCTLWSEGTRYEINVDTSSYPYPLAMIRGAWYVEPRADGQTTVGMEFAFQPQPSWRGRAFAVAMQALFPLVLRRIIHGWRRTAAGLDGATEPAEVGQPSDSVGSTHVWQ